MLAVHRDQGFGLDRVSEFGTRAVRLHGVVALVLIGERHRRWQGLVLLVGA